jgi:hypothetical protein
VQFYVRRRYPAWLHKYNYILAAAISGGIELLVFVTTFVVQGTSGVAVPLPPYLGNNFQKETSTFLPLIRGQVEGEIGSQILGAYLMSLLIVFVHYYCQMSLPF